jgi:hypothetical protein
MNLNNQINGGNMKSWWIIIVALFLAGWAHAAEGLQPYLLLDETRGNSRVNLTELKEGLEEEGFVVLGSYEPAEDSRRKVLSFTHPKLLKVVSGLRETAGYFSVWRMALTEAETGTEISLQNPEYWGNAYLQDEYPVAESTVKELISRLLDAFGSGSSKIAFGSSQEFSAEDLREYIICSACLILRIRWNWGNSNPITRPWKPSKRTSGIQKTASRFSVKP